MLAGKGLIIVSGGIMLFIISYALSRDKVAYLKSWQRFGYFVDAVALIFLVVLIASSEFGDPVKMKVFWSSVIDPIIGFLKYLFVGV